MRYEIIDHQWTAIKPMLPNKPRELHLSGMVLGLLRRRGMVHGDRHANQDGDYRDH